MYAKAYKKVTGKAPTTDIRKVQEKRAYETAYHEAKIKAIKAKAAAKARKDTTKGSMLGGLGNIVAATNKEMSNFTPRPQKRKRTKSRNFQEDYFL